MSIVVNNLTGPGMLDFPATYQKSGFVPTTAAIVFISMLSSWIGLSLSNTIGKMPKNKAFGEKVEYTDAFRHYYGVAAFNFTHVLFFMCVMSQCVASIVSTAQVADAFIASAFNSSVALQFDVRKTGNAAPTLDTWSPGQCDEGASVYMHTTLICF